MKTSGIGGQAVIEGVMMKNKSSYAVAVRKDNGEIELEKGTFHGVSEKHTFFRLPIIRGVVSFVESLILGMKTLSFSASLFEEEEEKKKDEKKESLMMGLTMVVSIIAAIGIFMILPLFLSEIFHNYIENVTVLAVIEGVIRIALFIGYVCLISLMEDIKRVFMYHGAEHKVINCVEAGDDLTVANAKKHSKHHKRCGTSFMFIVMFVSIVFFIFIHVENIWLRVVYRLLLVPVVAGVSYELIKFAGRNDNLFVKIISAPGVALQNMTTREPDDKMLEVAIQSVEAVFDWKEFHEQLREEKRRKENLRAHGIENVRKESKKKRSEKLEDIKKYEEEHAKRVEQSRKEKEEAEALEKAFLENVKAVQARREKQRMADIEKQREDERKKHLVEESDEILDKLDRYFDEKEEPEEKAVAKEGAEKKSGKKKKKGNRSKK